MSYSHNQRRKLIRRLKRRLKELYGFDWQSHFKKIMKNFQTENKTAQEIIWTFASAINSLKGGKKYG